MKYKVGDSVWIELEYFPTYKPEIVYIGPAKIVKEVDNEKIFIYFVEIPMKIEVLNQCTMISGRNVYSTAEHEIKYKI